MKSIQKCITVLFALTFFAPHAGLAKTFDFEDVTDGEYESIDYGSVKFALFDLYTHEGSRSITVSGGSLLVDERIGHGFSYLIVDFSVPVRKLSISVSGLVYTLAVAMQGKEFASRTEHYLGGYWPDQGGNYVFEYGSKSIDNIHPDTGPISQLAFIGYAPENSDPEFGGYYRYSLDSIRFEPVSVSPVPLPAGAHLLGGALLLFGSAGVLRRQKRKSRH